MFCLPIWAFDQLTAATNQRMAKARHVAAALSFSTNRGKGAAHCHPPAATKPLGAVLTPALQLQQQQAHLVTQKVPWLAGVYCYVVCVCAHYARGARGGCGLQQQ
jgi:hypothetical protein